MLSAAHDLPLDHHGMRRQVTVIFVDLVGFSRYASVADAEELQDWLDRFYDRSRSMVTEAGGEVTEFLGDGIIGVFGLGHADELAARRAVEIAVRLVAPSDIIYPDGTLVTLRAGVATGEVATRSRNEREDLLPRMTGMVTTLAQRLQSAAAPGEVLVAQETHDLLRGAMVLTPRPGLQLKGFAQPLIAYAAAGHSGSTSHQPPLQRRRRPFVGRRALRARIVDNSRPCLLLGQAGIGKSALASTFMTGDHICLRGDALKSGQSYQPFQTWLLTHLGRDRPDFALLEVSFPRLDNDIRLALALVLNLPEGAALPARFAGGTLSSRIEIALERAILDRLPGGTLIVEDLHWLDSASFGVLRRLVDTLPATGIRLLMTSRETDRLDQHLPDDAIDTLPLDRLDPQESEAFLDLFGGGALDAETRADLIRHAGGIPLFLEQLVKYAAERPWIAGAIPATLNDLLNARIESAGPARDLLPQSAVLGHSFSARLLKALAAPGQDVDMLLDQARDAGILEQISRDEWSFTHALLHRCAYRRLLRGTREALHGRAAELLQGECADLPGAGPALLASHQSQARLYLPAAQNYLEASRIAMMQGAFSDAETQARAALTMCRQSDGGPGAQELEIAAQTALGSILMQMQGYAAAPVRAAFDEVLRLASGSARGRANAAALFGSFSHAIIAGDRTQADQLSQLLIQAADAADARLARDRVEIRLAAHAAANCGFFYGGEFPDQFPQIKQIRRLYNRERHAAMIAHYGMDIFAAAQMFEIPARVISGQISNLDALLAETDAHQQALNIPVMQPYALIWGAVPLFHAGRLDEALARLQRGLSVASDQGAVFWQITGRCWHHVMDPNQNACEAGREDFRHVIATLRGIGALIGMPYFNAHYALSLARAGYLKQAQAVAARAVADGARSRLLCWQAETMRIYATLAHHLGRTRTAHRHLHQSLSLAEDQGARLWMLHAATDLAALPGGDDKPLMLARRSFDEDASLLLQLSETRPRLVA